MDSGQHHLGPKRLNTGKDNGAFVEVNPLPINLELLQRGEQRYGIWPALPRRAGGWKQVTKKLGFTTVANLRTNRIIRMTDGEIFSKPSAMARTPMLGYAAQVPVEGPLGHHRPTSAPFNWAAWASEADVPAPVLVPPRNKARHERISPSFVWPP